MVMLRKPRALGIWMNGVRVGRWERRNDGNDRLSYEAAWIDSTYGRPLSLSLPLIPGTPLQGTAVSAYFENLLPDNDVILHRIQQRYQTPTRSPFDLLTAVGRDCAGAVQLLRDDVVPDDPRRIDATPIDEAAVAQLLRDASLGPGFGPTSSDAFRLSIAGAQEKTALLRHGGQWCIPRGSTPSTHILKLPLGLVGNLQLNLRDSVDLEWLSMELVRAFGLPVARCEVSQFEDQRVLVVERFDRHLATDGTFWQRLPQEDFCQALGMRPAQKYEAEGGPGIRRIMDVLRGSAQPAQDRETFFAAQVLFWLLAATDGHAKNFSLHLKSGGAWQLTPLYDILSTWPIQGRGAKQIDPHKARLAMAVEGKNRHYRIAEIQRRHWVGMAQRMGMDADINGLLDQLVAKVPRVLDQVAQRLPPAFPAYLFETVSRGLLQAAERLQQSGLSSNQTQDHRPPGG